MTVAVAAFVGLGSNLGDRHGQLRRAVAALSDVPGVRVVAVSRAVETEALVLPGSPPQPAYLNAVVQVETTLAAPDLLARLHAIEAAAGRVRTERWAARTLDLDLLVYGDAQIEEPGLTVPHPRMTGRRFVLEPLADLAPDLVVHGRTVRDWLDITQAVKQIDPFASDSGPVASGR